MIYFSALSLTNFRNYEAASLDVSKSHGAPVVLVGPNGAGKTNVLEALSFFSPGRGLRRAGHDAVRRDDSAQAPHSSPHPWAVSGALNIGDPDNQETHQLGTGEDNGKRIVRLNGATIPQGELGDLLSVVWLTPQMDRLFVDSSSHRRRFVDRLVYNYNTAHLSHLKAYETAMRQRLKLLKDGVFDDSWLAGLEHEMVDFGTKVIEARAEVLAMITKESENGASSFPVLEVAMSNSLSSDLSSSSHSRAGGNPVDPRFHEDENIENFSENFAQKLAENRRVDAQSGITNIGPHRSDLVALFLDKKTKKTVPAAQCSTGEQKALLIAIILANARGLTRMKHNKNGASPILLLDEIAAHLDESRRADLFDEICAFSSQCWMTGTEAGMFKELPSGTLFFEVTEGQIEKI